MYNILVDKDGLIKDYNRDYTLFNNVIVVSQGGQVLFVYSDLSSATCNVIQIVEPINDFIGNKYMYVDGEVIINPDYVIPEE